MKVAAAVLLILAACSLAADDQGRAGENRTGSWWRALPKSDKAPYRFFSDVANTKVMVPSAIYYLSRSHAGDSPEELAKLLAAIRRNDG